MKREIEEEVLRQQMGFEMLACFSRSIAMLPLEEWLMAMDHAEVVGPVLDPTLAREYFGSEKAAILKELIRAAIPLKAVVLRAQPAVERKMKKDKNETEV